MKRIATSLSILLGLAAASAQAQKFSPADYRKALWMTTRFYGAQRQGAGPNWLLMDHTYPTSYMRDSANGRDLTGGWFDCGDFPLFGQTFFYSTYMLLLAYDVFPTGFADQYHGFDYSDYAAAKDFTYKSSVPDGIPDLLQEVKYATDWIIKATPDEKTFYFQKGTGGSNANGKPYGEHRYWVTSGYYSFKYKKIDGGESDSGRPIFQLGKTSGHQGEVLVNDGSMPSFAAAALAVMSRVYRKYDPAYADTCLAHARFAYAFAKTQTRTGGTGLTGFYGANAKMDDDITTASVEMYRATGETGFKDYAIQRGGFKLNTGYTLCYNDNDDLALYALGRRLGASAPWDSLKLKFVDRYKSKGTGESGLSTLGDKWGFLRYPANQAFVASLYADSTKTKDYDEFIYNQIDYIMGANPPKQAFIVGFCSGCSKRALYPHHRNVYLSDRNNINAIDSIPERNKEFGYMLGFTNKIADSIDQYIDNYTQMEGGLDYNAGLVGALAYINSRLDPVDTSKFGATSVSSGSRVPGRISVRATLEGLEIKAPASAALASVSILDLKGREIARPAIRSGAAIWTAPRGTWIVTATTTSGTQLHKVVAILK